MSHSFQTEIRRRIFRFVIISNERAIRKRSLDTHFVAKIEAAKLPKQTVPSQWLAMNTYSRELVTLDELLPDDYFILTCRNEHKQTRQQRTTVDFHHHTEGL